MKFEERFESWFQGHVQSSSGERKRRLMKKYGEAEKKFLQHVWLPSFGTLEGLSPEHEVLDAEGRTRYMDHAYLRPGAMWGFEVDGYGPHLRDIDRDQFADERRRDVSLQAVGWRIARFAFDDVNEKPWVCRRLIEILLSQGALSRRGGPCGENKDRIVRRAMANGGAVNVKEAREAIGKSDKPTLALLRELVRDGVMDPCSGGAVRVHRYRVRPEALAEYWGTETQGR